MPSGFMPNGTVANHSIAGLLRRPSSTVAAMNASMVPWEVASKHAEAAA